MNYLRKKKSPNLLKASHLLRMWCNWYLMARCKPYPVFKGKHLRLLSLLRKSYSDGDLIKFMWMHLHDASDFVNKAGNSLELLGSQIPKYIQTMQIKEDGIDNANHAASEYERRRRIFSQGAVE